MLCDIAIQAGARSIEVDSATIDGRDRTDRTAALSDGALSQYSINCRLNVPLPAPTLTYSL